MNYLDCKYSIRLSSIWTSSMKLHLDVYYCFMINYGQCFMINYGQCFMINYGQCFMISYE